MSFSSRWEKAFKFYGRVFDSYGRHRIQAEETVRVTRVLWDTVSKDDPNLWAVQTQVHSIDPLTRHDHLLPRQGTLIWPSLPYSHMLSLFISLLCSILLFAARRKKWSTIWPPDVRYVIYITAWQITDLKTRYLRESIQELLKHSDSLWII